MNGRIRAALIALLAGIVLAPLILAALVISLLSAGQAAAAGPCGSSGGGSFGGGPTRVPIVGHYTVTSEYGMRFDPYFNQYQLHAGVDLATSAPAPIVAMAAGTVISAGMAGTAGNLVVIDHGSGVTTRSMHMSALTVSQGQRVVPGQQIGIEGATGAAVGMHLHFEVKINGTPTNPRDWLASQGVILPPLGGWGDGPGTAQSASAPAAAAPSSQPPASSSATTGNPAALPSAAEGLPASSCAEGMTLKADGIPAAFQPWIVKAGAMCPEIPAPIIAAQIEAESGFNPRAISPVGAQGASQFMPETWTRYGKDDDGNGQISPFDIGDAVMAQGRYDCAVAAMLKGRVPGNIVDNSLAAYNAGEGAVLLYGGVPPYAETQNYVKKIRELAATKYSGAAVVSSSTSGSAAAVVG